MQAIFLLAAVATIAVSTLQVAKSIRNRKSGLHLHVLGVDFVWPPDLNVLIYANYQKFAEKPDELKPGLDVKRAPYLGYCGSHSRIKVENRNRSETATGIAVGIPNATLEAVLSYWGTTVGARGATDVHIPAIRPSTSAFVDLWTRDGIDKVTLSEIHATSSFGPAKVHFHMPPTNLRLWINQQLDSWGNVVVIIGYGIVAYALLVIVRWVRVIVP